MKFILDFLFGKDPKIFDKDGTVRHQFPDKKWDDWNNRYHRGAEFNWRNHIGTKAQEKPRPST